MPLPALERSLAALIRGEREPEEDARERKDGAMEQLGIARDTKQLPGHHRDTT